LARWIVDRFGIDLDACAEHHNAIVPRFIGPPGHKSFLEGSSIPTSTIMVAEDAFASWTIWSKHGRSIFCNMPFAQRSAAFAKACEAFDDGSRIVLLGPDDVASSFVRPVLERGAVAYRFVSPGGKKTGRLAYEGVFADDPYKRPAFGSALLVLDPLDPDVSLRACFYVDVETLDVL
jgi:hypothetical protein